jgi:uncharacterized protein (DUF302 family)
MERPLSFDVRINAAFDDVIERTTAALAGQGFGVLTRIDVHDTLREKIGVEFRRYVILGACNPPIAHRALSSRAEVGLMLPCNVTVDEVAQGTVDVRIANPHAMMAVVGQDKELAAVADEATERLGKVAARLAGTQPVSR